VVVSVSEPVLAVRLVEIVSGVALPVVVSDAEPLARAVPITSAPDELIVRLPEVAVTLVSRRPEVVIDTDEPETLFPAALAAVRLPVTLSAPVEVRFAIVLAASVVAVSEPPLVSVIDPPVELAEPIVWLPVVVALMLPPEVKLVRLRFAVVPLVVRLVVVAALNAAKV